MKTNFLIILILIIFTACLPDAWIDEGSGSASTSNNCSSKCAGDDQDGDVDSNDIIIDTTDDADENDQVAKDDAVHEEDHEEDVEFGRRLAAGFGHTCAINSESIVYCWGYNAQNKVGHSIESIGLLVEKPVRVIPDVKEITAAHSYTCALKNNGAVVCWGEWLEEGVGSVSPNKGELIQILFDSEVKMIRSGLFHSCAIVGDENHVACWGFNTSYQAFDPLDYGPEPEIVLDEDAAPLTDVIDIVAGMGFSCALKSSGQDVYCWGSNYSAQNTINQNFVDETIINIFAKQVPGVLQKVIEDDLVFKNLEAGWRHVCGISIADKIHCWGYGMFGQLADQAEAPAYTNWLPTEINVGKTPDDIFSGNFNTCILNEGSPTCWGTIENDLTMNNVSKNTSVPIEISSLKDVVEMTLGLDHMCSLNSSEEVWCWGRNNLGQLGVGDLVDHFTPTHVVDLP